jgi:hypothetical protein
MTDILIQENEGITKFFTLMLEVTYTKLWSLNAIPTSSLDIFIHLEA